MTEVQKALYGHREPDVRIGWTPEERERKSTKERNSKRPKKEKSPDPATIQRVIIVSSLLDDGPRPVMDIIEATQLDHRHIGSFLTTAENMGLLIWTERGLIGCINSRRWRDQYLSTQGL